MKVLVQLQPMINSLRVDGRKAWIGKDKQGNLTYGNIYTSHDAASELSHHDYIKLKHAEQYGSFKILDIV